MHVNNFRSAKELPGHIGFPYIGHTFDIILLQQEYLLRCFQRYGSIFRTNIMGTNTVVISSPEANKIVLKNQDEIFSSKLGWKYFQPLLGDGVLLQDNPEHMRSRQLLCPNLQGKAARNYFDCIKTILKEEIDKLSKTKCCNLYQALQSTTLRATCSLILGVHNTDSQIYLQEEFTKLAKGIHSIIRIKSSLIRYGSAIAAKNNIENHINSHIESGSLSSECILYHLLNTPDEQGNNYSTPEIITQCIQILFGGYRTTAKVLLWSIIMLHFNRSWLECIKSEYHSVSNARSIEYQDFSKLASLTKFVKETERLYPPFYLIPRTVLEDIVIDNYYIPSGWNLIISPFLTHRSNIYFHPEKFDPNRFNSSRNHPPLPRYSFISFGGGNHQCIGMDLAHIEIYIFLIELINNQDWSLKVNPKDISSVNTRKAEKSTYIHFNKNYSYTT